MTDPTALLCAAQRRRGHRQYDATFATAVQVILQPGGYMEELNKSVGDHVPWSQAVKKRRAQVIDRFVKMHAFPPWKAFEGREFDEEAIIDRAKSFLTVVFQMSQNMDDPSQRMRWTSLNTICRDVYMVIVAYCKSAQGNTERHKQWNVALHQHAQFLAERNNIPRDRRPKYYFGTPEVLLMVETALTCSQSCMDNILQHVLLWVLMFYTAARPGSLIATDNYRDCYLRYEDVAINRTETPLEFNVEIKVVSWKGAHGFQTWSQTFRLSPVRSESHLLLDVGLLLVIIGLRRRAFQDYNDLDSLIAGRDATLRWKSDWLKRPVFCAAIARGLALDLLKAMRYAGFREFLKTTCINAGLGDQYKTAYCFRRGTSTTMTRVLGSELARAMLHHKQNSETLHRSYAYNATQQDLTSAILYDRQEDAVGRSKFDAPALYRPIFQPNAVSRRLTWKEALAISDELRLLQMQRVFLYQVWRAGGEPDNANDVWNTLLDFDKAVYEGMLREPESRLGVVQQMQGHLSLRCSRVYSRMQERFQRVQARFNFMNARLPTLDEITDRLARLDTNEGFMSVLRHIGGDEILEEMAVISCPGLESPEDSELEGNVQAARLTFARTVVHHVPEPVGKQGCPFCQVDVSLPDDKRNRVYTSRSKLERHIQEIHRYLVAKPMIGEPVYDAMVQVCWGDSIF